MALRTCRGASLQVRKRNMPARGGHGRRQLGPDELNVGDVG